MCRPLWARYRARLPSFWLCSSSFCNRRNYNKITPRVYCVTCFILSYKLSSRLQNWSQLPLSRALSHPSVSDGAELLVYPRRRKGKTCSNMQRSETRLSKTSWESRSLELENCILVSAWPWILVGTSHGLYFDILFVFDVELLKQWARILSSCGIIEGILEALDSKQMLWFVRLLKGCTATCRRRSCSRLSSECSALEVCLSSWYYWN